MRHSCESYECENVLDCYYIYRTIYSKTKYAERMACDEYYRPMFNMIIIVMHDVFAGDYSGSIELVDKGVVPSCDIRARYALLSPADVERVLTACVALLTEVSDAERRYTAVASLLYHFHDKETYRILVNKLTEENPEYIAFTEENKHDALHD